MTLASSIMANARKTQKTCNWPSFAKASEGEDGKNRVPVFASLHRGTASRFLSQKAGTLKPFIAGPLCLSPT
jgi:hypothetical protein